MRLSMRNRESDHVICGDDVSRARLGEMREESTGKQVLHACGPGMRQRTTHAYNTFTLASLLPDACRSTLLPCRRTENTRQGQATVIESLYFLSKLHNFSHGLKCLYILNQEKC